MHHALHVLDASGVTNGVPVKEVLDTIRRHGQISRCPYKAGSNSSNTENVEAVTSLLTLHEALYTPIVSKLRNISIRPSNTGLGYRSRL